MDYFAFDSNIFLHRRKAKRIPKQLKHNKKREEQHEKTISLPSSHKHPMQRSHGRKNRKQTVPHRGLHRTKTPQYHPGHSYSPTCIPHAPRVPHIASTHKSIVPFYPKAQIWKFKIQSCPEPTKVGYVMYCTNNIKMVGLKKLFYTL